MRALSSRRPLCLRLCCRSGQQSPFRGPSHGAGRYRRSLLSLEFWASVISISSVSSTSSLQWAGLSLQPIRSAHVGTHVSVCARAAKELEPLTCLQDHLQTPDLTLCMRRMGRKEFDGPFPSPFSPPQVSSLSPINPFPPSLPSAWLLLPLSALTRILKHSPLRLKCSVV